MDINSQKIEQRYKMIFPLLFEDLKPIIIGGGLGFAVPLAYTYYQQLNYGSDLREKNVNNIQLEPNLRQIQIGTKFYKIAQGVTQRNELDLIDLKLEDVTEHSGGLVKLFEEDSRISSLGIGILKLTDLDPQITRIKDSIIEIEKRMDYQRN